jgi:hypothetical protein
MVLIYASVKNISQHYQSSRLRRHVVWYKFTDAYNKHATSLSSILQMETMIPINFGICLPDHMPSYPIRKKNSYSHVRTPDLRNVIQVSKASVNKLYLAKQNTYNMNFGSRLCRNPDSVRSSRTAVSKMGDCVQI